MLLSLLSDQLLLPWSSLCILDKQLALLTKWVLDVPLVRKWGGQIAGLCKFSEPFFWSQSSFGVLTAPSVLCTPKLGLVLLRAVVTGVGKLRIWNDLSGCTEVHFFSSLPSPIAFPAVLTVILPATLQLIQIISHGIRVLLPWSHTLGANLGHCYWSLSMKR